LLKIVKKKPIKPVCIQPF